MFKKSLDRADIISLIEAEPTLAQNKLGWNEAHVMLVGGFADQHHFILRGSTKWAT